VTFSDLDPYQRILAVASAIGEYHRLVGGLEHVLFFHILGFVHHPN